MNDKDVVSIHWSFWLVGTVALLWNIGGSINFIMQMNPEMLSMYRDSERAIIDGRPIWATGGFAIGVFGGTVGCLLLLFKNSISFYIFVVSLLGIIVTMIHTINVASSKFSFSSAEIFWMILSPIIVAAILIWYSRLAERKGWIN